MNESLYHLTKLDTLKKILDSQCLWVNPPENMNDPLESLFFNKLLLDLIDPDNKELLRIYLNDYCSHTSPILFSSQYYLLCFNVAKPNYVHWAYYGDNGYGICLAINQNKLEKLTGIDRNNCYQSDTNSVETHPICSNYISLRSVKYINSISELSRTDQTRLKNDISNDLLSYKSPNKIITACFRINDRRPLFKSKDFEHEQEKRLIIPNLLRVDAAQLVTYIHPDDLNRQHTPRREIPLGVGESLIIESILFGPKFFDNQRGDISDKDRKDKLKDKVADIKDVWNQIKPLLEPSLNIKPSQFFKFSESSLMTSEQVVSVKNVLLEQFPDDPQLAEAFERQIYNEV